MNRSRVPGGRQLALPIWVLTVGAVLLLLYFASLESRIAGAASSAADSTLVRDTLSTLDTLRGELDTLREEVGEVGAQAARAASLEPATGGGAGAPVGTIMAFAGQIRALPPGWLLCDGSELHREGPYADLFAVVGTLYGDGNGGDTFNLPDYRGLFLRGVDDPDGPRGKNGAGRDPDAAERVSMKSASVVGDVVGSIQDDATRAPNNPFITEADGAHQHVVLWSREGGGGLDETRHAFQSSANRYGTTTIPRQHDPRQPELDGAHLHAIDPSSGDQETRPKNASVHWIIKAVPG